MTKNFLTIIVETLFIAALVPAYASAGTVYYEDFNGSIQGIQHGITFTNTPTGQGAVFSRVNESRIEYPFANGFPREGTIEYRINVDSGYHYSDYVLNDHLSSAMIFNTGHADQWYPGAMWLGVSDTGDVTLGTATAIGPQGHGLAASGTGFSFGTWHTVGMSFGSLGQYIMVDGSLVGANAAYTETMHSGDHDQDNPTLGQLVETDWGHNQYSAGFEGVIDTFRVSDVQKDWVVSAASPVPEPGSMLLFGTAIIGLVGARLRKERRN